MIQRMCRPSQRLRRAMVLPCWVRQLPHDANLKFCVESPCGYTIATESIVNSKTVSELVSLLRMGPTRRFESALPVE
jgi:hypothetical protein